MAELEVLLGEYSGGVMPGDVITNSSEVVVSFKAAYDPYRPLETAQGFAAAYQLLSE